MVQDHRNIRSQLLLDPNCTLRGQLQLGAVNVRTKNRLSLSDLGHLGQAENLETAAVCQNRLVPANKLVQSTQFSDQFRAWTKCKVVGVAEYDLGARRRDLIKRQAFHSAAGTNGHESWQVNHAARRVQAAKSCPAMAVNMQQFKLKASGVNPMACRSGTMRSGIDRHGAIACHGTGSLPGAVPKRTAVFGTGKQLKSPDCQFEE
jgi:hypothetical protein